MANACRWSKGLVALVLASVFMVFTLASHAESKKMSLTNPDYEAFEVSAVGFVVNENGELVQVSAKGCPRCPAELLLPKRDMEIVLGEESISVKEAVRYQGSFALVTVEHQTGMVMDVWLPEIHTGGMEGEK
ncbi:hypothetical protein [Marinobacter daepoensis]|uniref:hypothetical protein n=1 Tax=Marinobacter daepoensis TaxID=262077 RepID=UPI0012EC56A4|nr:hypothetical protein [Marinobacter daepoensis]